MKRLWLTGIASLLVVLGAVFIPGPLNGEDPKLTAEELIEKHLASIGPAETLSRILNRRSQGESVFEILQGGSGRLIAQTSCVSEGKKFRLRLEFDDPLYSAEDIVLNDSGLSIATTKPGQRSLMGDFLYTDRVLLKEGLFNGVLSTHWALTHWEESKASLKYRGLKRINGVKYHALQYRPRRGASSLKIYLYFEQDTFRHVMTTYRSAISRNRRSSPNDSVLLNSRAHVLMTEEFDTFVEVDGMILPTRWRVRVNRSGMNHVWTIQFLQMGHNIEMSTEEFKAR